ncbi:MAG: discoidin domain-containing protein [Flavobacterium lindanitolerans]|uniref:discoidin domain-containing protein n=1 Tax=Flavobacterium lindanitolerans TaxID=428988 RepID=UPI001A605AF4|nr:discoidin domain-containing protein [Flavobacterium lindanitolerans]MBL7869180.1 discoidin domain-containing protein [Flavobacterium lindanitolerans]
MIFFKRQNLKKVTKIVSLAVILLLSEQGFSQQKTYCNPINIDYGYCPIPNFVTQGKHRATADPVITNFKGEYYLFSTNQWGYWHSSDMLNWKFISRKFLRPEHKVYDELCAPSLSFVNDTLLVIGSTHTKDFPLWMSKNPKTDDWKELVHKSEAAAWDPQIFWDKEKDEVYMYYGSSNLYPLYGVKLNRKTFQPEGERIPVLALNDDEHGWERFGEHNDNTFLQPFTEGAFMTKYKNRYYLQYGAPGTEFSGYADGVYVGSNPLGPFEYQSHNPFSYKPGGFARGAGHGATYQDTNNDYWHVSTIVISTKNNFERRIGIWPAGFDEDGILYSNTAYGDYPTFLPSRKKNHLQESFSGWMLLNYNKPVQVSSTLGGFKPNFSNDEDIKTYWSAKTGAKGEYLISDLGEKSTIHAIQINFADQDVELMGKPETTTGHKYIIYSSNDGKSWKIAVDKSKNTKDVPHDYIELEKPITARYLKVENIQMPTGKFAISGFRIFGKGAGQKPDAVQNFAPLRAEARKKGERRSVWFKWQQEPNADGYVIYFGKSPEKLYGSIMVYGKNEYYFSGLDRSDAYYFQIEAFNSNGIGPKSEIKKSE